MSDVTYFVFAPPQRNAAGARRAVRERSGMADLARAVDSVGEPPCALCEFRYACAKTSQTCEAFRFWTSGNYGLHRREYDQRRKGRRRAMIRPLSQRPTYTMAEWREKAIRRGE